MNNGNRQYLGLEAKKEKSKTTLFSQTIVVGENKVSSFFSFLASRPRYLPVFTFGRNHLKVMSVLPNYCTAIFKVNNKHLSDILCS